MTNPHTYTISRPQYANIEALFDDLMDCPDAYDFETATSVDKGTQRVPRRIEVRRSIVRTHWHIENRLHWVLDMSFREDDSRLRKDEGAHNFAILRHIAHKLLKQEDSSTDSVQNKRLRAGWDNDYLLRVLSALFV